MSLPETTRQVDGRQSDSHGDQDAPKSPIISVIMPVHNGERFLDEAICSVRNQTLSDIELIVLDDGSTDGSATIADRHAESDARVRVIRLQRIGIAGALNEGILAARADWIARLDSDDIALPHRLERQFAFIMDHPGIGAVGAYGWDIGERGGDPVGMNRNGPTTMEEYDLQRRDGLLSILTPAMVFKRDVALELGGYRQEFFPSEDADFTNRIADTYPILVIPEPLICYRIHGRSETTNQLVRQMRLLRRVELDALRRRAGQPEYAPKELDSLIRDTPRFERVRQELEWRSHGFYRRGGALIASGHPAGGFWLAVSALLYPPLPIRRLRHQRVLAVMSSRILKKHRPSTEEA